MANQGWVLKTATKHGAAGTQNGPYKLMLRSATLQMNRVKLTSQALSSVRQQLDSAGALTLNYIDYKMYSFSIPLLNREFRCVPKYVTTGFVQS